MDYENIWKEDEEGQKDLVGFIIDVHTCRGTWRYIFKRVKDGDGFFVWEQEPEYKIKE